MSGKRNIGRTLTLLLMFLITVIVILVIFSYFTGLFGLVGNQTHDVQVSGVFSLNPGQTSGTLAITLTDISKPSVTAVAFLCPSSQIQSNTCNGLSLSNSAGPVSAQNPLKTDETAGGASTVQLVPGVTLPAGSSSLDVVVTVTFSDGSTTSQTVVLPTQA